MAIASPALLTLIWGYAEVAVNTKGPDSMVLLPHVPPAGRDFDQIWLRDPVVAPRQPPMFRPSRWPPQPHTCHQTKGSADTGAKSFAGLTLSSRAVATFQLSHDA